MSNCSLSVWLWQSLGDGDVIFAKSQNGRALVAADDFIAVHVMDNARQVAQFVKPSAQVVQLFIVNFAGVFVVWLHNVLYFPTPKMPICTLFCAVYTQNWLYYIMSF